MSAMASPITSLTIVYSAVYSGADQRKHQSSASLAFVRGIHHWAVNSHHKGPVTRKMFPFDDVIIPSRLSKRLLVDQWQGFERIIATSLSTNVPLKYFYKFGEEFIIYIGDIVVTPRYLTLTQSEYVSFSTLYRMNPIPNRWTSKIW